MEINRVLLVHPDWRWSHPYTTLPAVRWEVVGFLKDEVFGLFGRLFFFENLEALEAVKCSAKKMSWKETCEFCVFFVVKISVVQCFGPIFGAFIPILDPGWRWNHTLLLNIKSWSSIQRPIWMMKREFFSFPKVVFWRTFLFWLL